MKDSKINGNNVETGIEPILQHIEALSILFFRSEDIYVTCIVF